MKKTYILRVRRDDYSMEEYIQGIKISADRCEAKILATKKLITLGSHALDKGTKGQD